MYSTVQGHKTFYSSGSGTIKSGKPAVIFIHGAGMDHSIWVLPARYFARHGFNVYAFDLPGHGRSEGALLHTIDEMSDWLHTAMKQLDINHSAIVGHSMGSLIALNFAARYPDKTSTLCLLGTSTPMPVTELLLDAAKANHHDAIDMTNTWSHSSFGQLGGNKTPGISMSMAGQRLLEQAHDDALYTDLSACNAFKDGEDLARQIQSKTLVIVAMQDKMTAPVSTLKVANAITGSQVVKLSPCGHSMLSEQPNAVLDALAAVIFR